MNSLNGSINRSAPLYNIKAVVAQTGLNPATIRAWERRYGLPHPRRTNGGHRRYSSRDIETLKWLIGRQEEGMSISHAIELWRSGEESVGPIADHGEPVVEPTVPHDVGVSGAQMTGGQVDRLRQAWIAACMSFHRIAAERVLAEAFACYDAETVCIELLQKGLREVGNGWYQGAVSIQQEHFTSALSVQRLEMLIAGAAPPSRPECIVVATAPGDFHLFSPLLITYLLRRRGWDVVFLGADLPADEFDSLNVSAQPALVIVSAQLLPTAAALQEIALAMRAQGIPLAYGGLVFNTMPELRKLIPGHFLGETLEKAVQRAAELIERRLPDLPWEDPSESYRQALVHFRKRRALVEAHIWQTFISTDKSIEHLAAMNGDLGSVIEAALRLGDISLLPDDFSWIEHLLMGYRLPRKLLVSYTRAYYQAADLHLNVAAAAIVEWLARLVADEQR